MLAIGAIISVSSSLGYLLPAIIGLESHVGWAASRPTHRTPSARPEASELPLGPAQLGERLRREGRLPRLALARPFVDHPRRRDARPERPLADGARARAGPPSGLGRSVLGVDAQRLGADLGRVGGVPVRCAGLLRTPEAAPRGQRRVVRQAVRPVSAGAQHMRPARVRA